MGLYLYGVISREDAAALGDLGEIGLPDEGGHPQPVRGVLEGGLVMLASPFDAERVVPVRRNLEGHHRVIRAAFERTTIVPMKFGHVARSEKAVQRMLRTQAEALGAEIARLGGKAEIVLKVRWDVENIFEYFISSHPEFKDLRDRVFGRSSPPRRDELIELGRVFERLREAERAEHTEHILGLFENLVGEHRESERRDEKVVASLTFLLPRDRVAEFESQVHRAAKQFDANFAFDFNGPWPPLSFVELDLGGGAGLAETA